ncbi:VOC family protein [Chromobacterium subtsugae]|uniref:VOC family protein n=1 Tax=Chromobacterium subtsugae TaxID=251747 RepID=UPI0007F903D9|nr:VOC family protein [Chromobacterium subtsugae]OBU88049.1 glyoxalase [Chromobacterium subtsugae]
MAIQVCELHHVGFAVPKRQVDAMRDFYQQVFGLRADPSRWNIPDVPGCFLDVEDARQLHVLGSDGVSRYAQGPERDPVSNHVAFTVASLEAAAEELRSRGVDFFSQRSVVADRLTQLFLRDPAGNLLELRQAAPAAD